MATYEEARINDIRPDASGGAVYDPYNPLNREITAEEVQAILARYGIVAPIQNLNLYRRAFVHKSYVRKTQAELDADNVQHIAPKPANCVVDLKTKSNDRLEFVGDGVLECVAKYYLYGRFPKDDEGFMTETKISIVKNESLGQIVLDMGLEKWYILSKNADAKHTRTNAAKLGNLFEAFLGAIFLDFNRIKIQDEAETAFATGPGFQMAHIFLNAVFERHVNWAKILENNDNYKNRLQVMIQKEFKCVPHYLEIHASLEAGYCMGVYLCLGQPIHNMRPEDAVVFPGGGMTCFADIHRVMQENRRVFLLLGRGQNKKKKKAEQLACENALQAIEAALAQAPAGGKTPA